MRDSNQTKCNFNENQISINYQSKRINYIIKKAFFWYVYFYFINYHFLKFYSSKKASTQPPKMSHYIQFFSADQLLISLILLLTVSICKYYCSLTTNLTQKKKNNKNDEKKIRILCTLQHPFFLNDAIDAIGYIVKHFN